MGRKGNDTGSKILGFHQWISVTCEAPSGARKHLERLGARSQMDNSVFGGLGITFKLNLREKYHLWLCRKPLRMVPFKSQLAHTQLNSHLGSLYRTHNNAATLAQFHLVPN